MPSLRSITSVKRSIWSLTLLSTWAETNTSILNSTSSTHPNNTPKDILRVWMQYKSKELLANAVNEIWPDPLTDRHLCRKRSLWVMINKKIRITPKSYLRVQSSNGKKSRTKFWKAKQIEINFMRCCRPLALKRQIIQFLMMKTIKNSFHLREKKKRRGKRLKALNQNLRLEDRIDFHLVETRQIGRTKIEAYKDHRIGMVRVQANKKSQVWWKTNKKL